MLVGQTYKLNFSGPFSSIHQEEVTLETIASVKSIISFGVNVFEEVFNRVGITKASYETWLAESDKLIYTFRRNDVLYKVPSGYFEETPPLVTVDYRQAAIVIELPYLSTTEIDEVNSHLDIFTESMLANFGLEVTPRLQPYGSTKSIDLADSDNIVATRAARKADAQAARPSVESLQTSNALLHEKLAGLEEIIIDKGLTN